MSSQIQCSAQLRPHMAKIMELPEARQLVALIQQEGPISVMVNTSSSAHCFKALWDLDRRVILVSMIPGRSEGDLIASILFELHNASITSQLDRLDMLASQRKIGKEKYVRDVEYLEFKNSHDTARLAEKGIGLGLFPRDARLPTYSTFEEHYRVQKMGGHSTWIGNTFDKLSST